MRRNIDFSSCYWFLAAICSLFLFGDSLSLAAQDEPVADSDTLVVFGRAPVAGSQITTVTGDYRKVLVPAEGWSLIRKGSGFGDDLYLDGFKRGDITLTLDGERMTTACPNRMDTHVARFHPLEIASISIDRAGGSLQSGLGGLVGLERSRPSEDFRQGGFLAGAFGRSDEADAGLIVEGDRLRLLGRWSVAQAWLDGDGRSFEDLYDYIQLARQTQAEVAVQGQRGPADFHLGFQSSRDHLFPYLAMDERQTEFTSGGAEVGDFRFYANRTAHLMDTGLRRGSYKITEVENINWGMTSGWGEIYGRYWDADNRIGAIDNHMLPEVWRWGATLPPVEFQFPRFSGQVRLGAAMTRAGDKAALALHHELYPSAEHQVASFPMAMVVGYAGGDSLAWRLQLELVRSAPEPEQLFIGVRKPMGMPAWVGNPELADPVRGTWRGELSWSRFRCDAFGSIVNDYPYLARKTMSGLPYQTYEGIDAYLAGAGMTGRFRFLDLAVNWNWGEAADTQSPLAEIQPLTATVKLKSPELEGARSWLQIIRDFGQTRVDLTLNERTTPAWTRLDLGVAWELGPLSLELEVENLADVDYWRHLSYLRNPFASGLAVHEPGRTGRMMVVYRP